MGIKRFFGSAAKKIKVTSYRHTRSQSARDQKFIAAVEASDTAKMDVLFSSGADPNANTGAALITAITADSKEQVSRLLSLGADVHIQHEMPLRTAMKNHNAGMAFLLIENGANAEAAIAYAKTSPDAIERANVLQWYRKAMPHVEKISRKQERMAQAGKSVPSV